MALEFVAFTIIECCFLEALYPAVAFSAKDSEEGRGSKIVVRRDFEACVEQEVELRIN